MGVLSANFANFHQLISTTDYTDEHEPEKKTRDHVANEHFSVAAEATSGSGLCFFRLPSAFKKFAPIRVIRG